jgi:hypothetical protein
MDAVLAVLFVSVMATFCMEILLAYELPAIKAIRNSMNTFFMCKSLTFEKLISIKLGRNAESREKLLTQKKLILGC